MPYSTRLDVGNSSAATEPQVDSAESGDADWSEFSEGSLPDTEPLPSKKRRRTTSESQTRNQTSKKSWRIKGKLHRLPEMPLDILFEVSIYSIHTTCQHLKIKIYDV